MIDYKEYVLNYPSFIGGWYMPENVCDELVDYYNNNTSEWESGKVGWEAAEDESIKKKHRINYFSSKIWGY